MKILVVSDTHGRRTGIESAIEQNEPIDMLLHLGDVEGDEDYIEALAGCPVHIVGGNNDFWSTLPREDDVIVEGHHIFMTHGHNYYVIFNEDRIREEAKRKGADIAIYGHTHQPSISKEDGILVLNPGSLSFPRQRGRQPSYILMELHEGMEPQVEIKYL